MKVTPKFGMVTLLTVVSATSGLSRASASHESSTEVRINVGNISHYSLPTMPLERLASALKHDPRSAIFRLAWYSFLSSENVTFTVLYSRRSRTLKFHAAGLFFGKRVKEHYLYNNVTDSGIQALAKRYGRISARPNDSFFPELRRYGCSRRRLP